MSWPMSALVHIRDPSRSGVSAEKPPRTARCLRVDQPRSARPIHTSGSGSSAPGRLRPAPDKREHLMEKSVIMARVRSASSLIVGLSLGMIVVGCGDEGDLPAPRPEGSSDFRPVTGWVDSEWIGPVSAVDVDVDGNVYALRRDANNVWKLDPEGRLLEEFAEGVADWAHGIRIDSEGYVWTVDGGGNQVKRWNPDGTGPILTLGQYGVTGEGPDTFNRPADVAIAPNGDIFVADGYGNSRVVKFGADGEFLKAWGTPGTGPGQFDLVHTIVIDRRERVLVGDRENARIQIFDLEGNFLEEWDHLGSPYGLYISGEDLLYVADLVSERIWIADASDGKLKSVVENVPNIHWVAVDANRNIYGATPAPESWFDPPESAWYIMKYESIQALP